MAETKAGHALVKAARYVQTVARRSIKFLPKRKRGLDYGKQASTPGTPPHTRSGRLKKSIIYEITGKKKEAFIGPSYKAIADIGGLHERGGTRISKPKVKEYELKAKGGVGPIAVDYDAPPSLDRYIIHYKWAKLTTQKMVDRANKLVRETTPKRIKEKFPARPFIGPAFEKSKPHIMRFFHNP